MTVTILAEAGTWANDATRRWLPSAVRGLRGPVAAPRQVANRDAEFRVRVIEEHLPLAENLARRYTDRGEPLAERFADSSPHYPIGNGGCFTCAMSTAGANRRSPPSSAFPQCRSPACSHNS